MIREPKEIWMVSSRNFNTAPRREWSSVTSQNILIVKCWEEKDIIYVGVSSCQLGFLSTGPGTQGHQREVGLKFLKSIQ